MNEPRSWFEPGAHDDPPTPGGPDLVDVARPGDTSSVERSLREALSAEPLPEVDALAALHRARGRGEQLVRRQRVLTVAAAAVLVVGLAGGGALLAGRLGPQGAEGTVGPATTTSPTAVPTSGPTGGPTSAATSAATPAPSEKTIYTDAAGSTPGTRPTLTVPTVPEPAVVRRTPCPEASSLGPDDPDPCVVDVRTGPFDPSAGADLGDLTVLSTALGTHGMPRSVSLDARGRLLATSGDDGWIQLSTVAQDGSSITPVVLIGDPRGPSRDLGFGWAPSVSLHPGGTLLAASWQDGTVMLWDVADPAAPRRLQTVGPVTQYTTDVLFSPDGSTLATAGYDNAVRLYRVEGDRLVPGAVLRTRSDALSLAWSADGTRLAGASYDETAVWDTTDPDRPRRVSTAPTTTMGQVDVALSGDGSLLFVTGDKAAGYDVSGATGRRVARLGGDLSALAVDPSGGGLVTVDRTGRLTRWAVSSGGALTAGASGTIPGGDWADSRGLAFDVDGGRLAVLTTGAGVVLLGA